MSFRPLICVLIVSILHFQSAAAEESPSTDRQSDSQSWPEIDVTWQLTPQLGATWESVLRTSSELQNPAAEISGLDLSWKPDQHWELMGSYYLFGFRTLAGHHERGTSPGISATYSWDQSGWRISQRLRVLGPVSTTASHDFWMYQFRIRAEHALGYPAWKVDAYLWDEPMYNSAFSRWTRNRLTFGLVKSISKAASVDLYYMRQDDHHVVPGDLNVIGLEVKLKFD